MIEITGKTDNYSSYNEAPNLDVDSDGKTDVYRGYQFDGNVIIDGTSYPFSIVDRGGTKTAYWTPSSGLTSNRPVEPVKAPIPPIAVALALLTIPIIALRKLN